MTTLRLFKHHVRVPFLLMGITESVIFFLAVYLGVYLRLDNLSTTITDMAPLIVRAMVFSIIMILSMIAVGLYQARLREGIFGLLLRMVASFFLGTIGLSAVFYIIPNLFLGRGTIAISLLAAFIAITVFRQIVYWTEPTIFKRRVLVLGAGEKAMAITELRRKSDKFGFTIVGFTHLRGEKDVVEKEKVIYLDRPLKEFVLHNDIDEIVLAVNDRRKSLPIHDLLECKMSGIDILDMLSFFERETSKIRLDQLQPSWLVFSDGFSQNTFRLGIKRLFDLSCSLLLLLISWPFMLVTMLAIWLEEGFSVSLLYRQVRVGEAGRPFQVLKFRSMREDAEKDGVAQWATQNDSRVTRVGGIIRKIRVDELPQIFNVLRGDMSFVGPRPERPQFVVTLCEKIPYYEERHRVKPGITGWAQLLYPYGSSERDAMEKLQYDLYYVKNHSLFLDFLIMLQTAEVVLFGKGAR